MLPSLVQRFTGYAIISTVADDRGAVFVTIMPRGVEFASAIFVRVTTVPLQRRLKITMLPSLVCRFS